MTQSRSFWLKAAGIAVLVGASVMAFAAYRSPDMLGSFADLMAFCASILR